MSTLYNCKHDGDQYRVTKFNDSFNVESSYLCSIEECDCPAGHRPTCRHRTMLPKFIERGHIGDGWFYDHDRNGWVHGPVEEESAYGIGPAMHHMNAIREDNEQVRASLAGAALPLQPEQGAVVDLFPDSITIANRPHSTAVSAADFESADIGSNPIGVAKEPAIGNIRRRV